MGGWRCDCTIAPPTLHAPKTQPCPCLQEVLWRLEECLLGAAVGVRMADGTTWLRQAGWNWQLTPFLEARLYPPGEAAW